MARRRAAGVAVDLDPATLAGALGDGVVDQHLVVAVGEGGVRRVAGRPAGDDVGVDRPEEGAERVGEALDVAARQRGRRAPGRRPSGPGCGAGSRSPGRDGRATGGRAVSESQAAAPSAPSISYWSEFFRPALIWETATRAAGAVREAEQDRRRRPRSRSARGDRVGATARSRRSRPGPVGSCADRDEGRQVGHHRDDRLAGQERHQVEPVRADVADRAERAALVRLEPPVPVGVEEQPVLEVAAGHEADVAQPAGGDQLADVLVERVEADVEVDRVDEAGSRRPAPRGRPIRRRSSPAASRRRRACRRPGSASACGTWRWFGEVTWTTSTSGSSSSSSSEA